MYLRGQRKNDKPNQSQTLWIPEDPLQESPINNATTTVILWRKFASKQWQWFGQNCLKFRDIFWTIFCTLKVNFIYFESNWCTSFSNQKAESKWWLIENEKSINLMLKLHFISFLQIKKHTNFFPWENPSLQPCVWVELFCTRRKKYFWKKTFTSFWSCKFVQKLLGFLLSFFSRNFCFWQENPNKNGLLILWWSNNTVTWEKLCLKRNVTQYEVNVFLSWDQIPRRCFSCALVYSEEDWDDAQHVWAWTSSFLWPPF